MKRILLNLVFIFICFNGIILSQVTSGNVKPFSLDFFSVYEGRTFNDSTNFSEFTSGVWLGYYFSKDTKMSLTSRYASVGGDVNSLSGLSDTQVLLKHSFTDHNIGIEGGLNIPSGKTKLTDDEFITSRVISQNIFGLNTSNFGQGLNTFLGLTWTTPLSELVVFGAGLSYQLKSEYQPLENIPDKYSPSNEISVTGGLDIKISELSTLTGDITAIFYGSDELNDQKVFTAGNRFILNTLYKHHIGYNAISVNLLYRLISVDEIEGAGEILDDEKVNPNQLYAAFSYFQRINSGFSINYSAFISLYEKTISYYSGYTMFGIILTPEFRISPQVRIPVILRFSSASADDKPTLTNFDIGSGIKINF